MTGERIMNALTWAFAITSYTLGAAFAVAIGVCCWVQVWN
jgi:hypothetical protein